MNLVFTNGSTAQKKAWSAAYGYLLNLPKDAIPLAMTVTFKPPSEVQEQTAFAETYWNYDSTSGDVWVRNDAPGFADLDASLIAEATASGLNYNAHQHFNETAVHELGHAVFAAIPHDFRVQIAQLFGAESDSSTDLNPPGSDWHDRIQEGIADTFKEAFLPARYRVFPNRTNRKISYADFPRFRRLIREGLTGMGSEEVVPETHQDIFEVDRVNQMPVSSFTRGWKGPGGEVGLYRSDMGGFDFSYPRLGAIFDEDESGFQRYIEEFDMGTIINADYVRLDAGSVFLAWVKDGSTITVDFTIPLDAFSAFTPLQLDEYGGVFDAEPDLSSALINESAPESMYAKPVLYRDRSIFFGSWLYPDGLDGTAFRPGLPLHYAVWFTTLRPDIQVENYYPGSGVLWNATPIPREFPTDTYTKQDGVWSIYDAEPDRHHHEVIEVDERFIRTRECRGNTYRLVKLEFATQEQMPGLAPVLADAPIEDSLYPPFGEPNRPGDPIPPSYEAARQIAYDWYPSFTVNVNSCSEGGGEPIVIPPSEVGASGAQSGRRPCQRPISGGRGPSIDASPA